MSSETIKKSLSVFLFCFVISALSFAQDYKDCADALVLCGESPFTVEFDFGEGINDSGLINSCLEEEHNSLWISLEIVTDGDVIFDIIPVGEFDDVDFAVFRLEDGECVDKTMVRCMASGESAGQGTAANSPCYGSTGLAYGETDMTELAGCTNSSNNYLAPMQVVAGEKYVLLINDFSLSQATYDISFGGTAEVACMSTTSVESTTEANSKWMSTTSLPGSLVIQINESFPLGELQVYNINGSLMHRQKVFGNERLELNGLNFTGLGIVLLKSNDQFQHEQVFVLD